MWGAGGESEMTTDSEMAGMTAVIQATPTLALRQELEAAGVPLPAESELLSLSVQFNEWLEVLIQKRNLPATHSYFALFKALDADGSGFLTYDEL